MDGTQTGPSRVGIGTVEDIPRAAAVIIAAGLRDDPVVELLVPGEGDRLERLTALYQVTLRLCLAEGGALDVIRDPDSGRILGAAAWEAPGHGTAWGATLRELPRALRALGPRHLPTAVRGLRVLARHRPSEPHWYLGDIAVAASARGMGVGAALLRHRLGLIDAEVAPAYLEATTPGSRRLYERHGFRAVALTGITADGYPAAMTREAAA